MDLKDKTVTVVGLGNSGLNAAMLLHSLGARVKVTDAGSPAQIKANAAMLTAKSVGVEFGAHTEGFIKGSSLVVLSPGVEDSSPAVKWADRLNVPIIGEMELGFRFCKGPIIAITGTNGKSTVTTLIGGMLKDAGLDAVVCGNIGNSLCGEVGRIKKDTWVVLEVSSFQLERIELFRPKIAIILNITDDHMDRYKKLSDYFNEKLKIFSRQTKDDTLILNYDAENLRAIEAMARSRVLFYSRCSETNGAYLSGDDAIYRDPSGRKRMMFSTNDVRLKGAFNIENALAAGLAASIVGAGDSIRDTLKNFKGLSHRVETVGVIDGVEYIDDSKGTTVDSTLRALEACTKPVILIAGGKDKYSDYGVIRDIVKKRVKALVLIGEAAGSIEKALSGATGVHRAKSMGDAVRLAGALAKDGYQVLLSPMCSSFDMFSSYKERGEVFAAEVKRLAEATEKVKR